MSEAAAYPVFLWAVLACHVCVAEPSRRSDALAVGRARARVLHAAPVPLPRRRAAARGPDRGRPAAGVPAAPPAGDRLRGRRPPGRRAGGPRPGAPPARRLRRDRDPGLAAACDRLEVGGDPRRRAGRRPRRRAAARSAAAGPTRRSARGSVRLRAFAAITALAVPLLALETGSYDVRFGGPDVIRDRYLFYLAPLLLLATGVCLLQDGCRSSGSPRSPSFFAATAVFADFAPVAGLWVDSPESVLNGADPRPVRRPARRRLRRALRGRARRDLPRPRLVPRPAAVLGVTVAVFGFGGRGRRLRLRPAAHEQHAAGRAGHGQEPRARLGRQRLRPAARSRCSPTRLPRLGPERDPVVGRRVLEQPRSGPSSSRTGRSPTRRSPARSCVSTSDRTRSPGPSTPRRSCSAAPNDSRFGLAGEQSGANVGLALRKVERPYRALWADPGARQRRLDPPRPAGDDPRLRGTGQPTGEGQARGHAGLAARGAAQRPPTGSDSHRLPCTHHPRRCGNDRVRSRGRPRGRPGAVGANRRRRRPAVRPGTGPERKIGLIVSGASAEPPASRAHREAASIRVSALPRPRARRARAVVRARGARFGVAAGARRAARAGGRARTG